MECEVFGEKHIDTMSTLETLLVKYRYFGDFEKENELKNKLTILERENDDEYRRKAELLISNYKLKSELLGQYHSNALEELKKLRYICDKWLDKHSVDIDRINGCLVTWNDYWEQYNQTTLIILNALEKLYFGYFNMYGKMMKKH